MKTILQTLDKHFKKIDGAEEELNPPTTSEALETAQRELGVEFPDDFRQLYLWHDGEKGDIFLFDCYRIFPLSELMEMNRASRKSMRPDEKLVSDDSGAFKDCIANEKWIAFGDNGGNSLLFIDFDPGREGVYGQILESCDGEAECKYTGIREFLTDISRRISNGEIAWDDDSGCFEEVSGEAAEQIKKFKEKVSIVNAAANREQLAKLNAGDETTLVGALKPDRKTNRHLLHIKGGAVTIVGELPKLEIGLMGGPPLVKVKVRVGKKPLFGIGTPAYEILSCERVPQ